MANLERIRADLEALRDITEACEEGTTRISYTPAYRKGVDYLAGRMKAFGLVPHEDGVGNLYGTLPGTDPDALPILSGSHLDTVRCSGYFDGQAGIVSALEAARMLAESGAPLKGPYQVVATVMEEGSRYPSISGANFITGHYTERHLDELVDTDGITLREALRAYGLPGGLEGVVRAPGSAKAFLELHMEQGKLLERSGTDLGIVENIYGHRWYRVTVHGAVSHPSSPMDDRRDTALAACGLVAELAGRVAEDYAGRATVTCGQMRFHPGEVNAVPSRAQFSLDFRSGSAKCLEELDKLLGALMERHAAAQRVEFSAAVLNGMDPVPTNPRLRALLEESADELGYSHMRMDSGAGHDAMVLAGLWDIAMIFVPSKDGLTHCPQEWTDYENLVRGADVLYETIRKIDGR